jgi:hypothetical protein
MQAFAWKVESSAVEPCDALACLEPLSRSAIFDHARIVIMMYIYGIKKKT